MARSAEELCIYDPKHLVMDKALIYSRRSKIRAIDLKILYHIFYYSDKFGGNLTEISVSDFTEALRCGIHTYSNPYLYDHLKEMKEIYKDMIWFIKDGKKYQIVCPLESFYMDEEKVSFKVDPMISRHLGKNVKDGADIQLTDLKLFKNTGLSFNIRMYEILKYEAGKTAHADSYMKLSYPEAVLMSGRVDMADEKVKEYYLGKKSDENFVYDEKLYDSFNTSMATLKNAIDSAVNEINGLSSTLGIEVAYKKLPQEQWVNRGIKLDGFLFRVTRTRKEEMSLEQFLTLSRKLDDKYSPSELDSIIRFQQDNFGNTPADISDYYKENEKLGRGRILKKLTTVNIAPEKELERMEAASVWEKTKDIKDGRYRHV